MDRKKEPELEHGSFYELGYGPPEGIKLDRAGWRRYFDDMHHTKHYHLTRHVFADVLPNEWRPEEIRISAEWLDGVDKDVTSSSHAFACCPRYQYIWQNGYGPEDGENLDIEGWRKYEDEMTEDKRKNMDNDLFDITHDDPVHDSKLWKTYMKQIRESEGFDVDVRITDGGGIIVPMFDDMGEAKYDDSLIQYSTKALVAYNDKEHTYYTLNHVVKSCIQAVVGGVMYYITFQGSNSEDHVQVFQAKVHQHPTAPGEIVLVRPKPMGSSFYRRIMRLGYGPPDRDKLDKAGWRRYFRKMHCMKLYHLILHVFGDDLPKEWQPADIQVEWLDGVDKDVTSRSHAFARCPRYQYIWQNGYGPPDGEKLDIKGWRKFVAEMPEEKRKEMYNELFDIPDDPVHDDEIWKTYCNQVDKSEGFDVDVLVSGGCGTISPMFYDMSQAMYDDDLINYSRKALNEYNDQEHTYYTLNHVVKACGQIVLGFMYYITFQASNSEGHIQDFQAKVHQTLKESQQKIVLVRPKPEEA